jgi:excisionase family DNA binding protein
MQAKSHRRRFSEQASSPFENIGSSYRALQSSRIALEAKAGKEFMGAREADTWLRVPLRSLHQYVQQGLLPSYKLGRHRLFRKEELLATLGANRTASRTEILR